MTVVKQIFDKVFEILHFWLLILVYSSGLARFTREKCSRLNSPNYIAKDKTKDDGRLSNESYWVQYFENLHN